MGGWRSNLTTLNFPDVREHASNIDSIDGLPVPVGEAFLGFGPTTARESGLVNGDSSSSAIHSSST